MNTIVTDDMLGRLAIKQAELFRRVKEGTLNPLTTINAIQEIIENKIRVWRSIKLGTGLKSGRDFRKALEEAKCEICMENEKILDKIEVSPVLIEIDLIVVSNFQLGFKRGATTNDIYNRGLEIGLDLCPMETGPQLRLQYKDQPKGEGLLIAMRPFTGKRGCEEIFRVLRNSDEDNGKKYLEDCDGASPTFFWRNPQTLWVFKKREA